MLKLTLRGLAAHKFRLVATSLAVLLGVAFMSGSLVLTDTLGKTFDDLFADVNRGTDAVVRSSQTIESQFGPELRAPVPEELVREVQTVPDVADAEGTLDGFAQFRDENGDAIGTLNAGPPTFGTNWHEVDELNPWTLVEGRAPSGPGQVVADKGTADAGGFDVGDTVRLNTQSPPVDLELVGIARFGTADSPAGASVALLETAYAQELIGEPGEFSGIRVVADEGVSQQELAQQLQTELPGDIEVLTGEELTEEDQNALAEGLGFFNTFLLVFAAVALFVGAFIIYNTFSIIVAQRAKEMALLRAIGAAKRQVLGAVLLEALAVGVLASVAGLVAGVVLSIGLKAAFGAFGFELPAGDPVILPRTVFVAIVIGTIVTVLSAFFPAIRAARVPPIAAMRDLAVDTSGRSRVRLWVGIGMLAVAVLSLGNGLSGSSSNTGAALGIGAGLAIIGVTVLGPRVARPVSRLLGAPIERLRGTTGRLARENAVRNPKRTASTASALMIGVGIVALILILATSVKASIRDAIDEAFVGDFVVSTGSWSAGGLSPDLREEIADLDEVDVATPIRAGLTRLAGEPQFVVGIEADEVTDLLDVGVQEGSLADLPQQGLAIHEDVAEEKGWEIGTSVPATFVDTGLVPLQVVAIYDEDVMGPYLVSLDTYEANFKEQLDAQVIIRLADGVDEEQGREAIAPLVEDYPAAELQNLAEFKASFEARINQLVGLIFVMLLLAIFIAFIGIWNTLTLSVFERTRELGLLRAVGMSRKQVRSAIEWESVIIAVLGTVLGLAVGIVLGWVIVQALSGEGVTSFVVPVGWLVVIVIAAALCGVGAAILPAHRASRLDILKAIATE
jgi:putative ABC transport system permease protein